LRARWRLQKGASGNSRSLGMQGDKALFFIQQKRNAFFAVRTANWSIFINQALCASSKPSGRYLQSTA
jgi:hypothetical protein